MNRIKNCNKCKLCHNQLPLLDDYSDANIMWVGLSTKKVDDITDAITLANDTKSGKIIEQIESGLPQFKFYKTNLVKYLPLDKQNKLRYPIDTEMNSCIENLLYEIEIVKPMIVFVLGKKSYKRV